jgi:hypothetical protein
VNAHLKSVVGVGTLTARGLAGHQAENLGGHADGAGNLKVLADGAVLQLGAHSLKGLHLAGGKSNADSVNCHIGHFSGLSFHGWCCHFGDEVQMDYGNLILLENVELTKYFSHFSFFVKTTKNQKPNEDPEQAISVFFKNNRHKFIRL